MKRVIRFENIIIMALLLSSCLGQPDNRTRTEGNSYALRGDAHFIDGYPAKSGNGDINVVIEIPSGSDEKWEVDKSDGILRWEFVNDQPRRIAYLAYPANYGMIPGTLLSEEGGGDGDPLDAIVLGPSLERGKVVRCRLIGVMYLLDKGQKDDKLIAVLPGAKFGEVYSLAQLESKFPGILSILQTWFSNYKGHEKIEFRGFGESAYAQKILGEAMVAYKKKK